MAGYRNRTALGIEKTGGCYLFLGADKLREMGPHFPPSLQKLRISHIPPWHVQHTLRHTLCAQNTNKKEAAGYWQADILLPSLVCRNETRTWCWTGHTNMHTSESSVTPKRRRKKGLGQGKFKP